MSFNLISKLGFTGYNREVRHETFCMNLPFITTKITGIDNQLLEKQIKDLCKETTGKESRSIYRKAGEGEGIFKGKDSSDIFKGNRTHQYLHQESLEFTNLGDIAIEHSRTMFNKNFLSQLVMQACWGIIYKKGDGSTLHHHGTSDVSWVYYVKTPKGSSPLVFPQCAYYTPEKELKILEIEPEEGLMVLFLGNVSHFVSPSEIDEERIVIAGNIDKQEKYNL